MINRVLYLCLNGDPEPGLVFPDELKEGFYSPGLFFIEEKDTGNLAFRYQFDAFETGRRISLSLEQFEEYPEGEVFQVQTQRYGRILFRALRLEGAISRYVGSRRYLQNHNPLRILEVADERRLEEICQEDDFFFVGSTE